MAFACPDLGCTSCEAGHLIYRKLQRPADHGPGFSQTSYGLRDRRESRMERRRKDICSTRAG